MEFKDVSELLTKLAPISAESPFLLIVVGLVALAIILSAAVKLFECVAKLGELVAASVRHGAAGLKGGRARRQFIQRRTQFLRVLLADLAGIGKAESWNDQHYTDLEAEVQVEGGYYATPLTRLLRSRSRGSRRVGSLMKAIDGSSERCLLLTGDPGSGKSVALRHLASQMIERSMNSKADDAPIPLYINLRELNLSASDASVDAIKAFVIDNVRRGDADTADYLKANWDDFQQRGTWFFLFDSFDEIPAVMHAAATDPAVALYGRAIQQFMDGLGECRGVLASREFKSPALHWPKVNILQLDESRQLELIERTFLSDDNKAVARAAVSLSQSATYRNPLFLTLLCKYVSKRASAPSNEHALLIDHVEYLARRDPEYLSKRWGFTPDDILRGAAELAVLLGDSPLLGLSPTVDEIVGAAQRDGFPFQELEVIRLIEALTYVKIGRTDVQTSDRSVRRFAFSHRRYQEGLYATRLSENLAGVDVHALVVDARRREYLVALLQIGATWAIEAVVAAGVTFLETASKTLRFRQRKFLGEDIQTYNWSDNQIGHVLSVFMEAKRYSPDGPWAPLQGPAEQLLARIWGSGDFYDVLKVVEYCGVGSADSLSSRLNFSIDSGIDRVEELAIGSCRFLLKPDETFASWIRQHVAARIVTASSTFERLQWEAVGAQLPAAYQMETVLRRARSIASAKIMFRLPYELFTALAKRFTGSMRSDPFSLQPSSHRRLLAVLRLGMFNAMNLAIAAGVILFKVSTDGKLAALPLWSAIAVAALLALVATSFALKVGCLDEPVRLSLCIVLKRWRRVKVDKRFTLVTGAAALVFAVPGLALALISSAFGLFPEVKSWDLAFAGSLGFFTIAAFCVMLFEGVRSGRYVEAARRSLATEASIQKAMSKAEACDQVVALSRLVASGNREVEDVRVAITYMTAAHRVICSKKLPNEPMWLMDADKFRVREALSNLLRAMEGRLAIDSQEIAGRRRSPVLEVA